MLRDYTSIPEGVGGGQSEIGMFEEESEDGLSNFSFPPIVAGSNILPKGQPVAENDKFVPLENSATKRCFCFLFTIPEIFDHSQRLVCAEEGKHLVDGVVVQKWLYCYISQMFRRQNSNEDLVRIPASSTPKNHCGIPGVFTTFVGGEMAIWLLEIGEWITGKENRTIVPLTDGESSELRCLLLLHSGNGRFPSIHELADSNRPDPDTGSLSN